MVFRKLALFSIRNRSWIICFWFALAGFSVLFAMKLPQVLGDHGLSTEGQYAKAQQRLANEFLLPDEPVVLLFDNEAGISNRAFRASVSSFLEQAERISGIDVAASPFERSGMARGKYAYALISVSGSLADKRIAIGKIRETIARQRAIQVSMTGKPVVQEDVNQSSRRDLKAAEKIGIPLAFALLLVTFGGIWPALIPILAGAMSVAVAMGIMFGVGKYADVGTLSVFVYNVIPMVGMAVCIDFCLMMVSRYREEKPFVSVAEAVVKSVMTSGKAVAISVACVVLALIGTLFIRMPIFNSVAWAALIVLAVAALINLTFVPAVLFILGNRISPERIAGKAGSARSFRNKLISAVMDRPVKAALFSIAILIVCLLPVRNMQMSVPGPESLPKGTESRAAAEKIAELFKPPRLSQVFMIVDERSGRGDKRNGQSASRIRSDLERDNNVVRIDAYPSRIQEGVYLLSIWLNVNEDSKEAMHWVREREKRWAPMGPLIGGEPKYHQEVFDEIFNRIKYMLAFVFMSNFLVLAWAFRSVLIPLKAILMNVLSIGASFGIVTWIFQDGRWGLEPADIAIMIPVFIFGLTFGISMDYGIFLLSRINESFKRTGNNETAVREGLSVSGKIIASAAAIMIAVTAPFVLADVTGVKQLGIGIATALFIDATIIRMVLVPSLMNLFGKWNWWMPFARNDS